MKIIAQPLLLILTTLCLYSCNQSNTPQDINLKKYFFQIEDYEKEKVLIYEHDSSGVKSDIYFCLKKIEENKLSVIRMSSDFKTLQKLTDVYKEDGVYLGELSISEGAIGGGMTKVTIDEGMIFPFKNLDETIVSKTSFSSSIQPDINGEFINTWKFHKIENEEIKGKNKKVIHAKCDAKHIFTNKTSGRKFQYLLKFKYQYTEGVGLTYIEQLSDFGAFKETYKQTISITEFNELRKSHQRL